MRRALVGGVSLAAVLVLASALYTRSTARELESRLAALKASGLPLTPLEAAPPLVPEGENAAPLWRKAFALSVEEAYTGEAGQTFQKAKKTLVETGEIDDGEALLLEKAVASNADALAQAALAAARPKCRFDVDYSQGFAAHIDYLMPLRKTGGIARLRALLLLRGLPDEALRSLEITDAAGRALDNEPWLISAFVKCASDHDLSSGIEKVLSRAEPSAAACRHLLAALSSGPSPRAALIRCIDGERAGAIDIYRRVRKGSEDELAAGAIRDVPRLQRLLFGLCGWSLNRDELAYLDFTDRVRAAAAEPGFKPSTFQWTTDAFPTNALASSVVPAFNKVAEKLFEGAALRDATRLALALRIARLEKGSYPETLEALVPSTIDALPQDPFSGAAFHYRREGAGFVVWSVGPNGKDEEGRHGKKEGDPDDVAVTVGR
jgi:hypothetical protein